MERRVEAGNVDDLSAERYTRIRFQRGDRALRLRKRDMQDPSE